MKKDIETLINAGEIIKSISDKTVFNSLANKSNVPWSLMLFSGYLKPTIFQC